MNVRNSVGLKDLAGKFARRPNLIWEHQHTPHIFERVRRASRVGRDEPVEFPGDTGNVFDPFEQADPFGRLKNQVTTVPTEESSRNRSCVDLRPQNVMDFEAEIVQCNFEFSACYLIGIMLPTGRKGYSMMMLFRPNCRTQKNLCQLRRALRLDHCGFGASIDAALMMNEGMRPTLPARRRGCVCAIFLRWNPRTGLAAAMGDSNDGALPVTHFRFADGRRVHPAMHTYFERNVADFKRQGIDLFGRGAS